MWFASPLYWLAVVALAAPLAAAYYVVAHDRLDSPFYRASLALYSLAWIVVGAVFAAPLYWFMPFAWPQWPPLWTGLPAALVVGVLVMIICGHLIAFMFGARRVLLRPRRLRQGWVDHRRRRHAARSALTEEELGAAEAYDAKWQAQDRERNQRFGTGPSL